MTRSGFEAAGHESSMNAERTKPSESCGSRCRPSRPTLLGTMATSSPSVRMRIETPVHLHHRAFDLVCERNAIAHIEGRFNTECDSCKTRPPVYSAGARPNHDRQGRGEVASRPPMGSASTEIRTNQYSGSVDRGGGEIRKEPRLPPSAVAIECERHDRNEHAAPRATTI